MISPSVLLNIRGDTGLQAGGVALAANMFNLSTAQIWRVTSLTYYHLLLNWYR
jgi:hypothetical protein